MANTRPPAAALQEDLVYHLYRGSELLMDDRLVEAKVELEKALEMQPEDERGRSMLAVAYFRLGMYPLAIEIYDRLLRRHPKDSTLRLNLGLALLRAQQPREAISHLRMITDEHPEHARAWRYLGAAYWHLEQLQDAHQAFVRAGRDDLATRVESHIRRSDMETASEGAMTHRPRALSGSIPRLALSSTRPDAWPAMPMRPQDAASSSGVRPRHVSVSNATPTAIAAPTTTDPWLVSSTATEPILIGPDGSLRIATHGGKVVARMENILAIEGDIQQQSLSWRFFGRPQAHRKQAPQSLAHLRGAARLVIAKPPLRSFYAVDIADQTLVVREDSVAAFCGTLEYEHSYLPMTDDVTMLQLRGTGTVYLMLERSLSLLRVANESPVRVNPSVLIGWTGDVLVMAGVASVQGVVSGLPCLCLRGEGTLLTTL